MTAAETCKANGWTAGITLARIRREGDPRAVDVVRVTGIGEEAILVRWIKMSWTRPSAMPAVEVAWSGFTGEWKAV